jgi:hypothetical protein
MNIKKVIVGIVILFFLNCGLLTFSRFVFIVEDGDKPHTFIYHHSPKHNRWSIALKNNTLNDTAKIGVLNLPPKYNGSLFTVDWSSDIDSMLIIYNPYKVTSGGVTIICYSVEY